MRSRSAAAVLAVVLGLPLALSGCSKESTAAAPPPVPPVMTEAGFADVLKAYDKVNNAAIANPTSLAGWKKADAGYMVWVDNFDVRDEKWRPSKEKPYSYTHMAHGLYSPPQGSGEWFIGREMTVENGNDADLWHGIVAWVRGKDGHWRAEASIQSRAHLTLPEPVTDPEQATLTASQRKEVATLPQAFARYIESGRTTTLTMDNPVDAMRRDEINIGTTSEVAAKFSCTQASKATQRTIATTDGYLSVMAQPCNIVAWSRYDKNDVLSYSDPLFAKVIGQPAKGKRLQRTAIVSTVIWGREDQKPRIVAMEIDEAVKP